MKVLVTGHLGYIGVHVVDLLKEAGHIVSGCDLGLFEDCGWEPFVRPDREIRKDVRDLSPADVEGHDCIMHLAAISNDPMGALDPEITLSVNLGGSVRLAGLAKKVGVPRFLFSGSCSVYGKGDRLDLAEGDPLNPLTAYSMSKIETEVRVGRLADDTFTPVFLRNATAFGSSPMLRIDLVVNDLLGSAVVDGRIRIRSDGSPWRPLVHCRDIARAFLAFAEAPRAAVHGKAVNVGGNRENYQVRDVAEGVRKLLPEAKIEYTGEVGNDPRSYRVRFDLLEEALPEFRLEHSLESGMTELWGKMRQNRFSRGDYEGSKFVRLRALRRRMDRLGRFA